jgi:hypothetical protein
VTITFCGSIPDLQQRLAPQHYGRGQSCAVGLPRYPDRPADVEAVSETLDSLAAPAARDARTLDPALVDVTLGVALVGSPFEPCSAVPRHRAV